MSAAGMQPEEEINPQMTQISQIQDKSAISFACCSSFLICVICEICGSSCSYCTATSTV
jgi:hypothetical protein